MIRTFGLPLACLAMFSVAGGHWAVLQAVAWGQMLRDYSRGATVAEAIEKTFDGEHPCSMCVKVKNGREREEKSPASVKSDKKSEKFLSAKLAEAPAPSVCEFVYRVLPDFYPTRAEAPPGPVPLVFIVSLA